MTWAVQGVEVWDLRCFALFWGLGLGSFGDFEDGCQGLGLFLEGFRCQEFNAAA